MPWSPNTKRSRRLQRKQREEEAQKELDETMLAEAPKTAVLKPPMPVKARKKGGDYGNHQATLNFQLPEHVSSITFDGTGEEPEGDEKQKIGQLAIGLVYEGDWKAKSKMAGKGQRVRCLDSEKNIEFLKAIKRAIHPLVHETLQPVIDDTMRLTILCGAQTKPHTDSFRGNTPNMMFIRGTKESKACPGYLAYDLFPKFKTSVVLLDGKLYVPHGYSYMSNEIRCIGTHPKDPTKPFYYTFHKAALDHMMPYGDLNYAIVGWTKDKGVDMVNDEGEVCIYRAPLTFNTLSWTQVLEDAKANPVRKPKKRIICLQEENKWHQFPAYKYRHWWVGNPLVVRYHVFFRSIRQTPVSSNLIRKGNRINYVDLTDNHKPKERACKRKHEPES